MVDRSRTFKRFQRPSFEAQVLENKGKNSKNKSVYEEPKDIVILKAKTKEKKPRKTKKKKTINEIHKEIKTLVEQNKESRARAVLKKALQQGRKGKRLDKWQEKLMGSRSRDLFHTNTRAYVDTREKKSPLEEMQEQAAEEIAQEEDRKVLEEIQKKLDEEKDLPNEPKESIITESNKEIEDMVEIPDLPLDELEAASEAEVEDKSIQDESGGSVAFGLIGAGQAGGRLVESFYKLGYHKCLAVNTAPHDLDGLEEIPENQKILMSTGEAGGAGKDMRKGEAAADNHLQEVYELMQGIFGKVDRILVCAGAGGGTGGGSCLRMVEVAKKYLTYLGVSDVNSKVGVLLTLPTAGEAASPVVADNAHLIATRLCELAEEKVISPLIIFDNDKIKRMYPKLTVRQFWPTVNATVTGLFHMFNVLSTQVGNPTSFDPADYNRVLSAGGCMIMGLTTLRQYADGTDISKAIRSNMEKGLLCGGFDVSTAEAAACIATASESILNDTPGLMNSLETGFDTLANITGDAAVFRGIYEVAKEKFVVYTMLTGLSSPTKRLKELKKFQKTGTTESKTTLYK
jgi:cell division GTPase FtsZ